MTPHWTLILAGLGLVVTLYASTRAALQTTVRALDRRLDQMHDTLRHILRVLEHRLPDPH